MTDGLTLIPIRHLDLDHIPLTVRINLREWKSNPKSRQYISFIQSKADAGLTTTSATSLAARQESITQAHLHKVAVNLTFISAANQSALKLAQVSINSTRSN